MAHVAKKERAGNLPRGFFREDLVLAIFHCIGARQEFRMRAFTNAMDEAAEKYEGMFLWAQKHPQYADSRTLHDVRSTLMLGGAVCWLGNSLETMKCYPLVEGLYGAKKFQAFSPHQQDIIRSVAARVIEFSQ